MTDLKSVPKAQARPQGTLSSGVFIPDPKLVVILAGDLGATFSGLGREQDARSSGNRFVHEIRQEMLDRGFQPNEGPMPSFEEGATHLLDGNGRCTALMLLAREMPDAWGKVKVSLAKFPKLTEDQRQEVINRSARSTAPFTEADYYKQSMLRWKARPDESYIEHLAGVGLNRAFLFFTPAPESAIIRDERGIRLKPGMKDEDLWGKGKGGQKQGPIQVGKELSMAHPRAVQAFFDSYGDDPEHGISYRELIDCNKHWKADSKLRRDLANPPAPWAVLVKEMPESELVNGVLGNRLAHGKAIQGGREAGKGKMSSKEVQQLANTLNFSKSAPVLLETVERTAGFIGEANLRDVEAIFKAIESMAAADNLDNLRLYQAAYHQAIARVHARAGAEAQAQRDLLLARESKTKK